MDMVISNIKGVCGVLLVEGGFIYLFRVLVYLQDVSFFLSSWDHEHNESGTCENERYPILPLFFFFFFGFYPKKTKKNKGRCREHKPSVHDPRFTIHD